MAETITKANFDEMCILMRYGFEIKGEFNKSGFILEYPWADYDGAKSAVENGCGQCQFHNTQCEPVAEDDKVARVIAELI